MADLRNIPVEKLDEAVIDAINQDVLPEKLILTKEQFEVFSNHGLAFKDMTYHVIGRHTGGIPIEVI